MHLHHVELDAPLDVDLLGLTRADLREARVTHVAYATSFTLHTPHHLRHIRHISYVTRVAFRYKYAELRL